MPANASYAQIAVAARSVRAHVRLPLDEMDLLLRLDRDLDGDVSVAEVDAARASIAGYIARHVRISADGHLLPLSFRGVTLNRGADGGAYIDAETESQSASRIGTITIGSDLLSEVDATHTTQAEIRFHNQSDGVALGPGAICERRIGADWISSSLFVTVALAVIAALWIARRRRAPAPMDLALLVSILLLGVARPARADVIMSVPALNATLKTMELLARQPDPEATFTLGVEADALAALMNQEVESHGMQERALIDLALARTKALGIVIAYKRDKKKFFYDGAAFAKYLQAAPRGAHAAKASFQLLSYQFYQSPATDIPALLAAVDATKRFLASYPTFPANIEARLFLAVDYRDLHRQYLAAGDIESAAKYRALARQACRSIIARSPRREQANAARQLLQGLRTPSIECCPRRRRHVS